MPLIPGEHEGLPIQMCGGFTFLKTVRTDEPLIHGPQANGTYVKANFTAETSHCEMQANMTSVSMTTEGMS